MNRGTGDTRLFSLPHRFSSCSESLLDLLRFSDSPFHRFYFSVPHSSIRAATTRE